MLTERKHCKRIEKLRVGTLRSTRIHSKIDDGFHDEDASRKTNMKYPRRVLECHYMGFSNRHSALVKRVRSRFANPGMTRPPFSSFLAGQSECQKCCIHVTHDLCANTCAGVARRTSLRPHGTLRVSTSPGDLRVSMSPRELCVSTSHGAHGRVCVSDQRTHMVRVCVSRCAARVVVRWWTARVYVHWRLKINENLQLEPWSRDR